MPEAVKVLESGRLAEWLAASPQGTLIIAGDLAAASKALSLGPADLTIGKLPDDPRAFNTVCICPKMGAIPKGYRRVVLMGCPDEWLKWTGDTYRLMTHPGWTDCLPDLEAMRGIYRALMELCRRPVQFGSLRQLAHMASGLADQSRLSALMSLLIIEDMGLFEYDFDAVPAHLRRLSRKKAEPEDSAVWRTIQRWRRENL